MADNPNDALALLLADSFRESYRRFRVGNIRLMQFRAMVGALESVRQAGYVISRWGLISNAPEGTAVLTQHEHDLFPVPAYFMDGDWLRETEGPEDSFYGAERHCPLYRPPTHWMHLPRLGAATTTGGE